MLAYAGEVVLDGEFVREWEFIVEVMKDVGGGEDGDAFRNPTILTFADVC